MDIDRGILKALFYDYPVDALVRLLDSHDMQHDVFLDIMPQLMQWSKPEYTYTEANLLRIQTGGDWKQSTTHSDYPTVYHAMDILHSLTERLLTIEKNQPIVQFEQLFRWKESALYVGEDLLVTAFLAQYDANVRNKKRQYFLWNDIVKHNNHHLNVELEEGLVDLHAHYNATADVFSFNWICLMNNVQQRQQFTKKLKRSQELELFSSQSTYQSTIQQHCVAAAYLRLVFHFMLLRQNAYIGQQDEEVIENNYGQKVLRILTDDFYSDNFISDLQASISAELQQSSPTVDGRYVDYCLLPYSPSTIREAENLKLDKLCEANYIYQGERQLLYTFFYGYYRQDPQCISMAPYFYLYLLLKNKIRREFIQINNIKGFENFQTYQDRKGILIPEGSPIKKYYPYYVAYTSVNSLTDNRIEVRVSPEGAKQDLAICQPMFSLYKDVWTHSHRKTRRNPFNVVVHFIKKGKYDIMPSCSNTIGKLKDGTRDEKYRQGLREKLNQILPLVLKKKIVGIDAASSEIFCRPETFGHVFRYAYKRGILGRTFHAGEDFLDLPDGLRAIDEAILFLQLDDKCRIGHAMALGIDAMTYYERRHYTTIITKQNLLDNCVWIYMRSKELNIRLAPIIEAIILEKACQLYHDIGYKCDWNIQRYWHSMLLRGDNPEYISLTEQPILINLWDKTAYVNDDRVIAARYDEKAKELFHDYFYDKTILKHGFQLVQYKWDKEIVRVMNNMQDKMRKMVSEKRISIECCPTSNLKIGYIDKYENHPLLTKFYPIDATANYPLIKSSINTDDRGVFYTSIYEEYSLIALALYKKKDENNEHQYNEREIVRYIAKIRKNAELMAFETIIPMI